jgi:hypothetical protein
VADSYKGSNDGLPDRDVRTIRDLIHYQYAKIIARSAFPVPDGTAAKGSYYGFIKQTFRELHKRFITYLRTSLNLWTQRSERRCLKTAGAGIDPVSRADNWGLWGRS